MKVCVHASLLLSQPTSAAKSTFLPSPATILNVLHAEMVVMISKGMVLLKKLMLSLSNRVYWSPVPISNNSYCSRGSFLIACNVTLSVLWTHELTEWFAPTKKGWVTRVSPASKDNDVIRVIFMMSALSWEAIFMCCIYVIQLVFIVILFAALGHIS